MDNKPLIGITPGFIYGEERAFINIGYSDAIIKAGGIPMLLPLTDDINVLSELLFRCDGLLFSGGPDVDAKYFNEMNLQCNGEISPLRDTMEIYLAKKAIELRKPVLGICRGIQIMNISLGGSIYQDISTQISRKNLIKHSQIAPKWYATHEINIEPDSIVCQTFNGTSCYVNSFHHQAVNTVAKDFIISSRSPDGIIESIEHKAHKFAVGVQWHPELMWQRDGKFIELFRVFVNRCVG